jgi:hypothetical protein
MRPGDLGDLAARSSLPARALMGDLGAKSPKSPKARLSLNFKRLGKAVRSGESRNSRPPTVPGQPNGAGAA